MHVVALLPRNLLAHLRMVLGNAHTLDAATDPAGLYSMLGSDTVDLLIVDPSLQDGQVGEEIEGIVARHRGVPVIVYTAIGATAMRGVIRLAGMGVKHVVLNRFDDEPRRFLELIERAPVYPIAELMLDQLAESLRKLPIVVVRAVELLFRSPARVRNSQELARLAGMAPRSLYRHLTPAGLQPRPLIVCARLLRAYTMLREPGSRLKEISLKLGYADPDTLSKLFQEWTGHTPKAIRQSVSPDLFVRLLLDHLREQKEAGMARPV